MKNVISASLQLLILSPGLTVKGADYTVQFQAEIVLKAQNCLSPGHEHLHEPQWEIDDFRNITLDGQPIPKNTMSIIAFHCTFKDSNIEIGELMENNVKLWAKENINMIEFRHYYRETQKLLDIKHDLIEIDDQDLDYLASLQH